MECARRVGRPVKSLSMSVKRSLGTIVMKKWSVESSPVAPPAGRPTTASGSQLPMRLAARRSRVAWQWGQSGFSFIGAGPSSPEREQSWSRAGGPAERKNQFDTGTARYCRATGCGCLLSTRQKPAASSPNEHVCPAEAGRNDRRVVILRHNRLNLARGVSEAIDLASFSGALRAETANGRHQRAGLAKVRAARDGCPHGDPSVNMAALPNRPATRWLRLELQGDGRVAEGLRRPPIAARTDGRAGRGSAAAREPGLAVRGTGIETGVNGNVDLNSNQ